MNPKVTILELVLHKLSKSQRGKPILIRSRYKCNLLTQYYGIETILAGGKHGVNVRTFGLYWGGVGFEFLSNRLVRLRVRQSSLAWRCGHDEK